MNPHRSHCGRFWAWTAAGFGLVLAFEAIFSLGPFLLVGLLGIAAALAVSLDAFLQTPLATRAPWPRWARRPRPTPCRAAIPVALVGSPWPRSAGSTPGRAARSPGTVAARPGRARRPLR
jgi:hypothetical protein